LTQTEVTQDYNAAFTGVNAAFIDYYGHSNFKAFTDCGLDLGWSHPNASNVPNWGDNDCYHTCNTNCTNKSAAGSTGSNGGSKSNGAMAGGKPVLAMGVLAIVMGAVAAVFA
jgi:endoglucanase